MSGPYTSDRGHWMEPSPYWPSWLLQRRRHVSTEAKPRRVAVIFCLWPDRKGVRNHGGGGGGDGGWVGFDLVVQSQVLADPVYSMLSHYHKSLSRHIT